jgi:hypothetical protein
MTFQINRDSNLEVTVNVIDKENLNNNFTAKKKIRLDSL